MREIRPSGSEGGGALLTLSLPLSKLRRIGEVSGVTAQFSHTLPREREESIANLLIFEENS